VIPSLYRFGAWTTFIASWPYPSRQALNLPSLWRHKFEWRLSLSSCFPLMDSVFSSTGPPNWKPFLLDHLDKTPPVFCASIFEENLWISRHVDSPFQGSTFFHSRRSLSHLAGEILPMLRISFPCSSDVLFLKSQGILLFLKWRLLSPLRILLDSLKNPWALSCLFYERSDFLSTKSTLSSPEFLLNTHFEKNEDSLRSFSFKSMAPNLAKQDYQLSAPRPLTLPPHVN